MDQVKFVEDNLKKIWRGIFRLKQTCLLQILLGPFLCRNQFF